MSEAFTNLRQDIDAQEQALGDLLARVMQSPLKPLHAEVAELRERLETIEENAKHGQSNINGSVQALADDGKKLKSTISRLIERMEGLEDIAQKQGEAQDHRHAHVEMALTSLQEQSLGHAERLAKAQQDAHAHSLQRQAAFGQAASRSEALLAQLEGKAGERGVLLTSVSEGMAKLKKSLEEVSGRQHHLGEQTSKGFNDLLVTVSDAAGTVAQSCATLSTQQTAAVDDLLRQELTRQLQPLLRRSVWLAVLAAIAASASTAMLILWLR